MMGPTYNGEDLTGDDDMDDKNEGPDMKKQCVKPEAKEEDADGTMEGSTDLGAPGGFGGAPPKSFEDLFENSKSLRRRGGR